MNNISGADVTSLRYVKERLPQRNLNSNKGDYGRALIIAGSKNMPGAGALCSMSALRSGAGIVNLLMDPEAIASFSPEIMVYREQTLSLVQQLQTNVIAIGPGLGIKSDLLEQIIKADIHVPMIIDADGLNSICSNFDILKNRTYPSVITPHPGEMSRIMKITIDQVQSDRINIAKKCAVENNVITVLKGRGTVIASPEGEYYINPTGGPSLSTAGTGDVLTGIIAALIGQGVQPFDAAVCGAYIHGNSGDRVSAKIGGNIGAIASDVIDMIPYSINSIAARKSWFKLW